MREQYVTDTELLQWAERLEAEGLMRAPADLKSQIMKHTKRSDVQMAVHTPKWNRGMELFFYSLKISAAAAMALFLLLGMPEELSMPEPSHSQWQQEQIKTVPEETLAQRLDRTAGEVSDQISKFANQWIKKEE